MHYGSLRAHGTCRAAARVVPRAVVLASCAAAVGCASVPPIPRRPNPRSDFWGFTAPWDRRSARSVAAHAERLDGIVSGWIALDSVTFRPVVLFPDSFVTRQTGAGGRGSRTVALVTSYQGTRFHPETVRGLAGDSTALAATAGAIAAVLRRNGYRGAVLDVEGMTPNDLPILLAFTRAVADSARAAGVPRIGMAIPATDTAAYPGAPLLRALDFLLVMLYDQHWLTSPPGPVASPDWVRRVLGVRIGEVGAAKLVAAFPTYGYQWRSDSATAVLSYDDAVRVAAAAHVPLERDPASLTLHAQTDGWTVWASDAVLLDTLVRDAGRAGVTHFALWRLGLEDPAVWTRVIR